MVVHYCRHSHGSVGKTPSNNVMIVVPASIVIMLFVMMVITASFVVVDGAFLLNLHPLDRSIQQQQREDGNHKFEASHYPHHPYDEKFMNWKARISLQKRSSTTLMNSPSLGNEGILETKINGSNAQQEHEILDIVLMGIGDLRVDDHGGLFHALSESTSNNKVLPIVLLNDNMIRNIPGVIQHTIDTANLLAVALDDINESLQKSFHPNLKLHYYYDGNKKNLMEGLTDVIAQIPTSTITKTKVRVHVCDLHDADNQMGYSPYSQLLLQEKPSNTIEIIPWNQTLRLQPWNEVRILPDLYTEYEQKYKAQDPIKPIDIKSVVSSSNINENQIISLPKYQTIPSGTDLQSQFIQVLTNTNGDNDYFNKDFHIRCNAEKHTGMFMSHWGGLSYESMKGSNVHKNLKSYINDFNENDQKWMEGQQDQNLMLTSNQRSLEHASMEWQLQTNQQDTSSGSTTTTSNNDRKYNVNNWLPGECMIRYLAAPLLFGTISPRRVWYMTHEKNADDWFTSLFSSSPSPLKQLIEGYEWHRLFAAKNIRTDPLYQQQQQQQQQQSSDNVKTTYHYWRYHGFLCRYALTNLANNNNRGEGKNENKDGLLLVHGFGASGAQWNKAMAELSNIVQSSIEKGEACIFQQGLAPDMLGFGHSEKPAVSYTGYMWDSQMLEFCKEIAIGKYQWKQYVTGGNSIGGFTSLSLAACDSASIDGTEVSSSGAPGTQRCAGLVLMNSAGPIKTKQEIEQESVTTMPETVAQITALGKLPTSKPPPEPVARLFGNGLLWYLRPRIQSICKNLYPTNPAAVDNELCEGILRDSLDPGAVNVMMAGAKLPRPRTANELLAADFGSAVASTTRSIQETSYTGPVLIAQGVLDPLNDAKDRLNRFASLRNGITADPIQAGHCPHDEQPALVAKSMASWMMSTKGSVPSSATMNTAFVK